MGGEGGLKWRVIIFGGAVLGGGGSMGRAIWENMGRWLTSLRAALASVQ